MKTMHMTEHAEIRKQQRRILPLMIDWLLVFGRRERSFGAVKVRFDRRARRDLASDVDQRAVPHLSKYLTPAIVLDLGTGRVITVEWLR